MAQPAAQADGRPTEISEYFEHPQRYIYDIYCANKSFRPLTQKLDSKAVTPCRGRPAGPKPLPKQDMNIYHPPLNLALFDSLVTSRSLFGPIFDELSLSHRRCTPPPVQVSFHSEVGGRPRTGVQDRGVGPASCQLSSSCAAQDTPPPTVAWPASARVT